MKIGITLLVAMTIGIVQFVYLKNNYNTKTLYCAISFIVSAGMGIFLIISGQLHFLDIIKRVIMLSILFTVAFTDYVSMKIPNKVILFGILLRIVIYCLELAFRKEAFLILLKADGIGFGIVFIFFVIAHVIIKNGVGMGDIKLVLLMSLYLGIQGVFGALFMSLICIFIAAVILLATKRKKKKDFLPFAPAILVGTILSLIINGI